MKIIIAPDSFKGTLTAQEVCEIASATLARALPNAQIHTLPLADGGEGIVAAYHALFGGTLYRHEVSDPFGGRVKAQWLLLPDGTAVLETASCAGLELARSHGLNPEKTTTRGLGELMLTALKNKAKRVLLGLGGSATNDGGCGMAYVLGWQFLNSAGENFCPTGGTLKDIWEIIPPLNPFPLPVIAACDLDATLYGEKGAAYVYAPQKGADATMVERLDDCLRRLAAVRKLSDPNATSYGAAGGLGFGVHAFLGGRLRSGIELILDYANFDALLEGADFVITAEGRMDSQTLQGKAPFGVLERAKRRGVRVYGICGCVGEGYEKLLDAGFSAIFPAADGNCPLEELRQTCREDLRRAVVSLANIEKFG
ncbi:MAG: glycerate kinase [Oscillospiraceae bacterium]|nr:glycerate kinase [Oscillospiraceae bacterium]